MTMFGSLKFNHPEDTYRLLVVALLAAVITIGLHWYVDCSRFTVFCLLCSGAAMGLGLARKIIKKRRKEKKKKTKQKKEKERN